jgi:hypothetical protein
MDEKVTLDADDVTVESASTTAPDFYASDTDPNDPPNRLYIGDDARDDVY